MTTKSQNQEKNKNGLKTGWSVERTKERNLANQYTPVNRDSLPTAMKELEENTDWLQTDQVKPTRVHQQNDESQREDRWA